MIFRIPSQNNQTDVQTSAISMQEIAQTTKNLIGAEINRHIQDKENYSLVIKTYGSSQTENTKMPQKEHLYKSIDKKVLQKLFAKINTGEDLSPKEIQILSELANAVQKSEFVINLGDRIIAPLEHTKAIQYDIQNHAAQVAKVKNIGENLSNLAKPEVYSPEEIALMRNAQQTDYSSEFKTDRAHFTDQYPLSGRISSESSIDSEPINEPQNLEITESALQSILKNKEAKEQTNQLENWSFLVQEIEKNSQNHSRRIEIDKDEEAKIEEWEDQKQTEELDEKHLRILEEWAHYTNIIEHLEDPSSLPGKNF